MLKLTDEFIEFAGAMDEKTRQTLKERDSSLNNTDDGLRGVIEEEDRDIARLKKYKSDYAAHIAFVSRRFDELYSQEQQTLIKDVTAKNRELEQAYNNARARANSHDNTPKKEHKFSVWTHGIADGSRGHSGFANTLTVTGYIVGFAMMIYTFYFIFAHGGIGGFKPLMVALWVGPVMKYTLWGFLGLVALTLVVRARDGIGMVKWHNSWAKREVEREKKEKERLVEEQKKKWEEYKKERPNFYKDGGFISRNYNRPFQMYNFFISDVQKIIFSRLFNPRSNAV